MRKMKNPDQFLESKKLNCRRIMKKSNEDMGLIYGNKMEYSDVRNGNEINAFTP